MTEPTTRGRILATAKGLTEGDRNKTYGSAYKNMANFAELLEGYFRARGWITSSASGAVTAEDAAHIMVLAKMARTAIATLPFHEDNYIDAAAYCAIAGECAQMEREA